MTSISLGDDTTFKRRPDSTQHVNEPVPKCETFGRYSDIVPHVLKCRRSHEGILGLNGCSANVAQRVFVLCPESPHVPGLRAICGSNGVAPLEDANRA